jgi:N-acetylneuraminic acid mutarotase
MRNVLIISILGGLVSLLFVLSCTKRQPEEVEYASSIPNSPYPPDASNNINHTTTDVTLSWQCTDKNGGTLCYTVYFDTLNPPLTEVASNIFAQSCFIDSLEYNTVYYWKVVAQNEEGVNTAGPVWAFTTLPHPNMAPQTPVYRVPTDGSSGYYPTLTLAWSSADPDGSTDTLHYYIYLSTSAPPSYYTYTTDTFYLTRNLHYETAYNWRIIAEDNHGAQTIGPLFSFSTRKSPWYYTTNIPTARSSFGTAFLNNKIVVIGGKFESAPLSAVEIYDIASNSWNSADALPHARSGLATAVWNGIIYALGGDSCGTPSNRLDAFDIASGTWTQLTFMPFSAYGLSAQTIDGKIYTFCGENSPGVCVSTVFCFDISKNTWSSVSVLPNSTSYASTAVIDNKIYLIGGAISRIIDSVYCFTPETNSWAAKASLLVPRSASSAVSVNGSIYVLGGYNKGYLSSVEKYDPVSDSWILRADMLAARSLLGTAYYADHIYVVGGLNDQGVIFSVEEYRLEEDPKNIPVR